MAGFPLSDAAAGAAVISPWVTEFKKLPIHFNPLGQTYLKEMNNAFATACSGVIYIFVRQSTPAYLINIWPWWKWIFLCVVILLGSSFLLISLLTWWRAKVERNDSKWPIPIHSLCYVILLCSITMGCGLVKLFEDYTHLSGKVMEAQERTPVERPLLQLYDANDSLEWEVQGDRNGNCESFMPKDLFKRIRNWRLEVSAEGYREERIGIANGSALVTHWRELHLMKEKE